MMLRAGASGASLKGVKRKYSTMVGPERAAEPVEVISRSSEYETRDISEILSDISEISFPVARESRYLRQSQVNDTFLELQIFDHLQFRDLCRKRDEAILPLWEKLQDQKDGEKMIDAAVRNTQLMMEGAGAEFEVRIQGLLTKGKRFEDEGEKTIRQMCKEFYKVWLETGMWDRKKQIFDVLCSETRPSAKKWCLYMWGTPSSGKTAIMNLITSVYYPHEIGTLSPQGSNTQFWMADLFGKDIYCADQILVTPLNVDSLKMLFEGNPYMTAEVKYKDKTRLRAKPCIATSNKPMWAVALEYKPPMVVRMEHFEFKTTVHNKYLHGTKEQLQQVLLYFYCRAMNL